MRIRLNIKRHSLGTIRIWWDTNTIDDGSPNATVSGLLESVNQVCQLETRDGWGLEDYVVEIAGFELLHFARLAGLIKEGDEVVIRPLDGHEIRERRRIGRRQISTAGRKLIDGVPFGRAFVRPAWDRPGVIIPPRKKLKRNDGSGAMVKFDDEQGDEGELWDGEEQGGVIEDEEETRVGEWDEEPFRQYLMENEEEENREDEEDEEDEDYTDSEETDEGEDSFDDGEEEGISENKEVEQGERRKEEQHSSILVTIPRAALKKMGSESQALVRVGITGSDSPKNMPAKKEQPTIDELEESTSSSSESFTESSSESSDSSDSSSGSDSESSISSSSSSSSSSDESSSESKEEAKKKAAQKATPPAAPKSQSTGTPFQGNKKTIVRRERGKRAKLRKKLVAAGLIPAEMTGQQFAEWIKIHPEEAAGHVKNVQPQEIPKAPEAVQNVERPKETVMAHTNGAEQANPTLIGKKARKQRVRQKRKEMKEAKSKQSGDGTSEVLTEQIAQAAERGASTQPRMNPPVPDIPRQTSTLEQIIVSIGSEGPASMGNQGHMTLDKDATSGISISGPGMQQSDDKEKSRKEWMKAHSKNASNKKKGFLNKMAGLVPKKWKYDENGNRIEVEPTFPSLKGTGQRQDGEYYEDAQEEQELWRKKIVLSAVECEHEDGNVPQPTFPFQQPNGPVPSARGQKRKRSGENWGRANKKQDTYQNGWNDQKPIDYDNNQYNQTDDWANHNYYEDEPVVPAKKIPERSKVQEEEEDLPPLPADMNTLPVLRKEAVQSGMVVAFKELTMDANYNPILADYKTALITEVEKQTSGDLCLWVKLAVRDRPKKKYDEETGERIYAKFEMPVDDEDQEEGMLEIMFGQMIEPRIVKGVADTKVDTNVENSKPIEASDQALTQLESAAVAPAMETPAELHVVPTISNVPEDVVMDDEEVPPSGQLSTQCEPEITSEKATDTEEMDVDESGQGNAVNTITEQENSGKAEMQDGNADIRVLGAEVELNEQIADVDDEANEHVHEKEPRINQLEVSFSVDLEQPMETAEPVLATGVKENTDASFNSNTATLANNASFISLPPDSDIEPTPTQESVADKADETGVSDMDLQKAVSEGAVAESQTGESFQKDGDVMLDEVIESPLADDIPTPLPTERHRRLSTEKDGDVMSDEVIESPLTDDIPSPLPTERRRRLSTVSADDDIPSLEELLGEKFFEGQTPLAKVKEEKMTPAPGSTNKQGQSGEGSSVPTYMADKTPAGALGSAAKVGDGRSTAPGRSSSIGSTKWQAKRTPTDGTRASLSNTSSKAPAPNGTVDKGKASTKPMISTHSKAQVKGPPVPMLDDGLIDYDDLIPPSTAPPTFSTTTIRPTAAKKIPTTASTASKPTPTGTAKIVQPAIGSKVWVIDLTEEDDPPPPTTTTTTTTTAKAERTNSAVKMRPSIIDLDVSMSQPINSSARAVLKDKPRASVTGGQWKAVSSGRKF